MKKKNFKISLVFVYTILIVWALTTIFPLLWSIMNSFKNKKAIYNNSFALPVGKLFSLDNYKAVFANYDILNAYRNSFIISGTVAVVVILFSGMAAYILTRYKFPGQGNFGCLTLCRNDVPYLLHHHSCIKNDDRLGNCKHTTCFIKFVISYTSADCRKYVICYNSTQKLHERASGGTGRGSVYGRL